MKTVKLVDVCDIASGGTPSRSTPSFFQGDIPWAKISDLDNSSDGVVTATEENISLAGLQDIRNKIFKKGTLLFAMYGSIGKTGIAGRDMATNQAILGIRPKRSGEIDLRYLKAWFDTNKNRLIDQGRGVALKNLSAGIVKDLDISIPSFNDQIRIAHLLGKVEGLIARRKQQLAQLDALLKSMFLEMFGDPVRNEKDWDKAPLEKLGSINRGVSKHRPRNDPQLLGGNHPLIQTGEVSNAGTYITTYTQTYSDIGFAQSKRWPAGTLCITIAANIAQTGILTFDACFPDSVVGFAADKAESNTLYVLGLFWFFQAILEKNAPAAAQKNINLEILRGLEVPKPPVELQNQFADAAEKIEALKSRYQQTLTDLETLYAALSQSAFKGELDLSRIPLPAAAPEPMPTEAAPVTVDLDVSTSPLPDLGLTAGALADEAGRLALLTAWLEAWQTHLGTRPFGLPAFLDATQTRLQTLYPESERELGMAAYEQIKDWVFAAHASG